MAPEAAGRDPRTATGLPPDVDPSLLPADEVALLVGTDPEQGLSEPEAARRLVEHGPNALDSAPPVPAWRRILAQLHDPLIYLLLGAVAVSLFAWLVEGRQGVPFDALVIAAIVLANAVLGFVQEVRASDAVASLQAMSAATAVVVRGGDAKRVPADDVVPGDVLLLAEGDAVAADARLAAAAGLTVAEASLTGESEPVTKRPAALAEPVALGDRTGMVFAGTAVTRGTGRAVVVGTGMDTENGRIARLLARTEGIFAETAGGVTVGVTRKLVDSGLLDPSLTTVVLNTGDGLKTLDAVAGTGLTATIRPNLDSFREAGLA